MLANILGLLQVFIFCGLTVLLYRKTYDLLIGKKIKLYVACIMIFITIILIPYLLTAALFSLGIYLSNSFQLLRIQSWDVALANVLFISMCICYLIGIIAISISLFKLISFGKNKT